MWHLSPEDLARLVDEDPSAREAEHLATCELCREELELFVEQSRSLAELTDSDPNPAAWARLRARLRREGLIGVPSPAMSSASWFRHTTTLRAAAAVGVFVLGGATGLLLQRDAPVDVLAPSREIATRPAVGAYEAEQALRAAEATYLAAMARYAELIGVAPQTNPAARLAALEGIVVTTRAALHQAPADPVINGYHLSALAQRDAMLRQIAAESEEDNWF